MKRIYDFGRKATQRNYTIADLQALKTTKQRLTMVNPANGDELRACIEAGIELFAVWEKQIDEVRAIAPYHFLRVGATWAQFGSQQEIMKHAFDMMKKGADIYYTLRSYDVMEALAKEGIPVKSHIGLIPTFSHYYGGLRGFGRNADEAMKIFQTIKRMEDVGVLAVEAECIAEEFLTAINDKTSIIMFSLGSGNGGDVTMSFVADICGEQSEEEKLPKHAHAFGNVGRLHQQIHSERVAALRQFNEESISKKFPYQQNNITMYDNEKEKFLEELDKWRPIHH